MTNPFESSDDAPAAAEETAKYFVQTWAEAVIRQAARTRAIRKKFHTDNRNYDRNEEWSPSEAELDAVFRACWAEEHTLVWSAHQLECWRARLAKERGETAPPPNEALKTVRDALEHLNEARLEDGGASSPAERGGPGRALRRLPEGGLSFALGGGKLFEILDPHRLDEEALKVVKSIDKELDDEARAMYELLEGER